jgi:hypothetical protein
LDDQVRALLKLESDNARLRQIIAQRFHVHQAIIPNAEAIFKEQEELQYKKNKIYMNWRRYGLNVNLLINVLTKEAADLRRTITSINNALCRVTKNQET